MARHTKKNIRDYAITGFRNGRKVYLSQTFDTYTVTEYMGDRMLWQDLSEAKTVAVNPTVIKLFGYDGNIEEIPLDLPSDRYDIEQSPVINLSSRQNTESEFREWISTVHSFTRKAPDGSPKMLSRETQRKICRELANPRAALKAMGCRIRIINQVPESLFNCRDLESLMLVQSIIFADPDFKRCSRSVNHCRLRSSMRWLLEFMESKA